MSSQSRFFHGFLIQAHQNEGVIIMKALLIGLTSFLSIANSYGHEVNQNEVVLKVFGSADSEWGASHWGNSHYFAVTQNGDVYYSNNKAKKYGFQRLFCPSLNNFRKYNFSCRTESSSGYFLFETEFRNLPDYYAVKGQFTHVGAPRGSKGDGWIPFTFRSYLRPLAFVASLGEYPDGAEACLGNATHKLTLLATSQKSVTSGKAGGLGSREPLKAVDTTGAG